jgi:hypothetical protein
VRSGAIIPQWPPMLYFNERRHDPMTLEVRDLFRNQNRSSDWDSPTGLFISSSGSDHE